MTMDVKNIFLNTPIKRFEYLQLCMSDIPEDIMQHYQLQHKATNNGYICVEVQKAMYRFPQAGWLAYNQLESQFTQHGFLQSKITSWLWLHKTCPIQFCLVIDDFGVKYTNQSDVKHLQTILNKYYDMSMDWSGQKHVGLTLDWDDNKKQVHLSIPGYIKVTLTRFQHSYPQKSWD